MAWIKMIPEEEAQGKLANLYQQYKSRESGMMDHILKIHSLDPPTMESHIQMYKQLMFGPSELSRKEREMIAVVVSVENSCHYWIVHHGEGLRRTGADEDFISALTQKTIPKDANEREKSIIPYARKLTSTPSLCQKSDVQNLQSLGFSDKAILQINLVINYFNYVNRLADGLGVELEDYWDQ